ncbi:MAG: GTPase ObgE [Clostridia bacterium]|jgi:GTP-binding protein
MFVDLAKVYLKAGNGGDGAVSFRREKYIPNGGPDGGDGGNGGNIVFVVDKGMHTLMDFRHRRSYKAQDGENGGKANRKGKDGDDLIIKVPPGTLVKDFETGRVIADLHRSDTPRVILRGGRGGKGNARFATATRQAPRFAHRGEKGQEVWVVLELKSIADVGLIGFPNVGKSTILSVLTAARPKIADYHFTTIKPNLGVVYQDGKSFILADIPGLVEGAHEGAGLGLDFLRHIERTRVFIHVLDASGYEGRDPLNDFYKINEELFQYKAELCDRPQVIAANKMDIPGAEEKIQRIREELEKKSYKVFPVSAVTGKGLRELVWEIVSILDTLPPLEPFEEEWELPDAEQETDTGFEIAVEEGVYVVTGPLVDRILSRVNLDDYDSFNYFQRQLRRHGIIDSLREKGITDQDLVRMGEIEFEFMD